jgi:D-alanyl-D-alanine carboxypeptidase (penicillin-binding protein 5/6)
MDTGRRERDPADLLCRRREAGHSFPWLCGSVEESDLPPQEQSFSETKRLLDWGFEGFAWQIVLDENEIVSREAVRLADGGGNVELRPERSISVLVRTDLTPEDVVKKFVIFAYEQGRPLTAPIREGVLLGEVSVIIDGVDRGKAGLVAGARCQSQ